MPRESQLKPPPTSPKLPPPPFKPLPVQTRSSSTLSISEPRPESTDPMRKRPSKSKDPYGGRSHSSQEEDEACRPSKQLRIGGQGKRKEVIQQSEPQAWLPAAMLYGKPLMDDATLRDFREGEGARAADALERSLLLLTDMAELGGMRGQEVAHNLKRYLGMAIQATFRLEEEVDNQGKALDQERDKYLNATNTLKKSEADLNKTGYLRDVEGQLHVAKEKIADLKQKLAEAVRARGIVEYARDETLRAKKEAVFTRTDAKRFVEQVEEEAFVEGVAKTEAALKAQVPEASSELRRAKKVYYPSAIREATSVASKVGFAVRATNESQTSAARDPTSFDKSVEETVHQRALEGVRTDNPEAPQDVVKPSADSQATLVVPQVLPVEEGSSEVAPPSQGLEALVETPR
nr:uncharacterized protein LOC111987264 [Quercus suber]